MMLIRELIEELEVIAKDHGDDVHTVVVDYENGPGEPVLSFTPEKDGKRAELRIT